MDPNVQAFLNTLEANRKSGRPTPAPTGIGGFFKRGAFKKAVALQGALLQSKIQQQIQDNVVNDIISNQSILRQKMGGAGF